MQVGFHRYSQCASWNYSQETQCILRSEPSSRAALMGEQPNPWDLSLPPLLVGQDYTFTMAIRVTTNAVGASRVIGLVSRVLSHLRSERTAEGSVVTGDETLDHCRRVLTPSSRSDIQKRQCICHSCGLRESSFPRGEPRIYIVEQVFAWPSPFWARLLPHGFP